jgi:chromate reductase
MKILALSGSLRGASTNTALLHAAAQLAPDGVEFVFHDYRDVPLYNGDDPVHPAVTALREAITAADAVLIATPEFNHGLPGVLKNALDHASRPAYQSPFRDKPVGVLSASASFVGGARAQQVMKIVLLGMAARVFPWPELLVGGAHAKFMDGELVDETTRGFLKAYVDGFAGFVAD